MEIYTILSFALFLQEQTALTLYENRWFLFWWAVLTLTLLLIVFKKILLPWAINRQKLVLPAKSKVEKSQLETLANYLNRGAVEFVECRPQASFVAEVRDNSVWIKSEGIDQSTVHEYLEQNFAALNITASIHDILIGQFHRGIYKCQLNLVHLPKRGIPAEKPHVILARHRHMSEYGKSLAAELLRAYPLNSSTVSYQINTVEGVLQISFKPVPRAENFFGKLEMPNSIIKDIKNVMGDLSRNDKWKGFTFLSYSKDRKVSTISIRLNLVGTEARYEQSTFGGSNKYDGTSGQDRHSVNRRWWFGRGAKV